MSKDVGLWASPPREPGPVPSWIAPRQERVFSRSPLRPASAAPREARNPSDFPGSAELRAPRTPSIPPPVIADKCTECELAHLEAEAAKNSAREAEERLASVRRSVLIECEGELVRLALAVAERIVGRELSADPSLVASWAREAIDSLEGAGTTTVAASPDVAASIPDADFGAPMTIDESLPPGTCEARSGHGRAKVSADARLAAVAEALGVDVE